MKIPCPGIRAVATLCVMLVLCACSAKRIAEDVPHASADAPVSDLPAAMSLMQPQAMYADLAELRHYSAYNAFHATQSSGSSGNAASNAPAPAACFGNQ